MKISDFISNNKIICVTHGGIMHADDLCSAALISTLTPKEVEVNIIRIGRDIKAEDIPSNALVFDVLNGEFDHHDSDPTKVDGRKLASFGKLFRAFKEDIKKIYNLDEEAWKNIDQNFVKYIDHTDNTGDMNPYNYMTNCISRVAIDSTKFMAPCGECEECRTIRACEYTFRIYNEMEYRSQQNYNLFFGTLTYNDAHLPFSAITDKFNKSVRIECFRRSDIEDFFLKN